jgi:hypothetical protein
MGVAIQATVTGVLIGRRQAHAGGDGFPEELLKGLGAGVGDHASDDAGDGVARLPLHGADDDVLAGPFATHPLTALVPVPILVLPVDVGFIDRQRPDKLPKLLIGEAGADAGSVSGPIFPAGPFFSAANAP